MEFLTGSRQIPEISRTYAIGGQQIVLRKIEILCVESTEEEGRLKKVTEILSEAIYAYLKQKTLVHKQSPLRGKENSVDYRREQSGNWNQGSER